jgi:acetyl esterase/lipase
MKRTLFLLLVFCTSMASAQTVYETEKNISYYEGSTAAKDEYRSSQCLLDVYYPKNSKNFSTIVWFHGGGLTGGAKEIPQAAAVAWAFRHIARYGGSEKQIYLSGHSAGGYLAMMITLDKKYLARYEIDADKVAELIPFSGQCITHFTVRKERGIRDTQPVIDELAPLYWVRADAPPMLLITGDAELELLGRYEENAYMLRMMKLAGHKSSRLFQLQGFDHGNMPIPAFPLLIKEIIARQKLIK